MILLFLITVSAHLRTCKRLPQNYSKLLIVTGIIKEIQLLARNTTAQDIWMHSYQKKKMKFSVYMPQRHTGGVEI
jgi:hypothetical protein